MATLQHPVRLIVDSFFSDGVCLSVCLPACMCTCVRVCVCVDYRVRQQMEQTGEKRPLSNEIIRMIRRSRLVKSIIRRYAQSPTEGTIGGCLQIILPYFHDCEGQTVSSLSANSLFLFHRKTILLQFDILSIALCQTGNNVDGREGNNWFC